MSTSEALDLDQKTYESFKDEFGEDYDRTLAAAYNLACSLRLVGDYQAARRLDQDTLRPPPGRCLGRTTRTRCCTAVSLASDMRAVGAFRDSVDLLREIWEQYRAVLGDDMPDTLRAATSLAVSLRKAGEQAEAMNLARDTYDRYERRYGSDSPETRCARSTWPATMRRRTTWPRR